MSETAKISQAFAVDVIRLAKINLGATRTKYRIKAKWKKLGPKAWQPISVQRIPFKARISNSGRLASSMGANLVVRKGSYEIQFYSTTGYGNIVNEGRKPGKYAPVDRIKKWTESKPVRVRDESGAFVTATESSRGSQNFLINRKIKHFGIEPTHFFDEALEQSSRKYEERFLESVAIDLTNLIK